jgi:hypothetical protein
MKKSITHYSLLDTRYFLLTAFLFLFLLISPVFAAPTLYVISDNPAETNIQLEPLVEKLGQQIPAQVVRLKPEDPKAVKFLKNFDRLPQLIYSDVSFKTLAKPFGNENAARPYFRSIGFNTFAVSEKLLRPEKYIKRKAMPNRLDVFVMSDCPFGKAAMKYLAEHKINQKYEVHVHYIVNKNPKGKTGRYIPYRSLHGESEFFENLRQICVQEQAPDFYWSYPFAEKPEIRNDYFNKIKNKSIEDCYQTANYRSKVYQLVDSDIKLTEELGISSSPTFLFNNQNVYVGLGTVQKALNWPAIKGQPAGSAGSCNTLPVVK